jgi:uncharacterized protein (DUF983 family)
MAPEPQKSLSQPSTGKAILQTKCPRCHQGEMFTHSAFSLRHFDEMPEHCAVCNFRYEIEVGFYWGAMYISYGLSVILLVFFGVLLYYLGDDPPLWVYIMGVSTVLFLFTTILFRYARVLMLYLFGSVQYDPKYDQL